MRFIPEVKFCNEERLHIYQPLRDPDVQQQQHTQVMLYWGVISHMNYEVQQQLNGSNGAHYTPRPPDPPTPTIWNHTEAQQMSTIRTPVTWGLVEVGGSVGGCSFITVETEPEPEAARGEEGSPGGVTLREEDEGSSRRSLSFDADLISGNGSQNGGRDP